MALKLLTNSCSVRDSILLILESRNRSVVLVDTDGRLIGTVSEGDILRGLLNGQTLESHVETVCNFRPIWFPMGMLQEGSDYLDQDLHGLDLPIPLIDPITRKVEGVLVRGRLERELDIHG